MKSSGTPAPQRNEYISGIINESPRRHTYMSGQTMRAMIFLGPGQLELRSVPVPKPADGEILLKIGCATTCGTDLKAFNRGYRLLNPPCGFGHECVGVVTETGAGVEGFTPGMRVVAHNSAPCNRCFYCKQGQQNLCENLIFNYGTYAEYITVPRPIVELNTFPIPDHLSDLQAPLIEPLMCVVHGHRVLQIRHGEHVAVIGTGPIGLMHVQLSRLAGAVQIIAVDLSDTRLAVAEKLGATDLINADKTEPVEAIRSLTQGRGVDAVIEAAGAVEAWYTALRSVRKGGRVEFFGGLKGDVPLQVDPAWIHYGEFSLYGTFHGTPVDAQRAYELIASGTVDTASLISDEMPLENVVDALKRMERGEVIKVAIRPDLKPQ
jgi:L-iditol 2-dehydrogenase